MDQDSRPNSRSSFTVGKKSSARGANFSIGGFRNSSHNHSPPLLQQASDSAIIRPRSSKQARGIGKKNTISCRRPPPTPSRPAQGLKGRRSTAATPPKLTNSPQGSPRQLRPNANLPRQISLLTANAKKNQLKKQNDLVTRVKKNEEFSCLFIIPRLVRAEIVGSCEDTVFELKSKLLSEVRLLVEDLVDEGIIPREEIQKRLLPISEYLFKSRGTNDYIMNESLPLQRVDFIQACTKAFVTPSFCLVERRRCKIPDEETRKQRITKEILLSNDIASLIGSLHTSNFLEFEDEEIASFRRAAIRDKIEIQEKKKKIFQQSQDSGVRDERIRLLPEYILGEPMPMCIPEKFLLIAHLPISGMKVTMNVSVVEQACKLRMKIFEKYKRKLPGGGQGDSSLGTEEDYILKVTGFQDFLYGESQMLSYDCVRKNLSADDGPLEISFLPLSDFEGLLNEINVSVASSIVDKLLVQGVEAAQDHSNEQSIFDVKSNLSVQIETIQRLQISPEQTGENCFLFVSAEIFHAGHKVSSGVTLSTPTASNTNWKSTEIVFDDLIYANIPLGTRILFTVYFRRCDISNGWIKGITKTDEPLAWVAYQLFDQDYRLRNGSHIFRMWVASETPVSPIGSCYQNLLQLNAPIIHVRLLGQPEKKVVYYPSVGPPPARQSSQTLTNESKIRNLNKIIGADPLVPLGLEEKMLLWGNRYHLTKDPAALPKFLMSLNWDDHKQVQEAHSMIQIWSKPSPMQALELLDAKFADPIIRDFGIECIQFMQDGECYDFMLQLTQVLKHEPFHNSALARFLLNRAWTNARIGHSFFWFLKSEMHLGDFAERYTLLLECYLRGCDLQLRELTRQHEVNNLLVRVAEKVKVSPSSQRKAVLHEGLRKLQLPETFQLPLDQRVGVSKLVIEKCKYMDSKKLPLWLVWENAEPLGKPVSVIFKVGDDLRQDALTLQIIQIFDKIWKNEGLDLLLKPYGCIATGDEIGMIEVVKNADTTANINKARGGTKAVLQVNTIGKWLKKHNNTPEKWAKAQEVFALSCAGYCVATFVLGIGDRHNDNIMLTRDGNLFHIDFGHFLGNYKKKYGFKRERAPFIFTQQYAFVLDGKGAPPYQLFVETACKAFNILRRHKDTFITLFQMMLCTGIPELSSAEDIDYLRNAFAVGLTDEEAANYFKKLITSSLNTKTTVINDAIHVFVHR